MHGKAFREVYEIISHMKEEDAKLISPDYLKEIYDSADWNYDFKYDVKKSLKDQKVSEDAKFILSLIYMRYFASVKEKVELLKLIKKC